MTHFNSSLCQSLVALSVGRSVGFTFFVFNVLVSLSKFSKVLKSFQKFSQVLQVFTNFHKFSQVFTSFHKFS